MNKKNPCAPPPKKKLQQEINIIFSRESRRVGVRVGGSEQGALTLREKSRLLLFAEIFFFFFFFVVFVNGFFFHFF
jgi:hypothetical protein